MELNSCKVCQTLHRQDTSSFNKKVDLLTKYLEVVLNPFLMYTTGVTEVFT